MHKHPISYLNRTSNKLKQVYKLICQKKRQNVRKRPQLTSDQIVDYSSGGAANTRTTLAVEWGTSQRSVSRSISCAAYAPLHTQEIIMRMITSDLLQIPPDYGGGVPNFDEAKDMLQFLFNSRMVRNTVDVMVLRISVVCG